VYDGLFPKIIRTPGSKPDLSYFEKWTILLDLEEIEQIRTFNNYPDETSPLEEPPTYQSDSDKAEGEPLFTAQDLKVIDDMLTPPDQKSDQLPLFKFNVKSNIPDGTVYVPSDGTMQFNSLFEKADFKITTDPSVFYIDATNDRIGMGLTSPTSKLFVQGSEPNFSVEAKTAPVPEPTPAVQAAPSRSDDWAGPILGSLAIAAFATMFKKSKVKKTVPQKHEV
jgi:hypothetical protein